MTKRSMPDHAYKVLGDPEISDDRSRRLEASKRAFADPLHLIDPDEPRSFAENNPPADEDEMSAGIGGINVPKSFSDQPAKDTAAKRAAKESK